MPTGKSFILQIIAKKAIKEIALRKIKPPQKVCTFSSLWVMRLPEAAILDIGCDMGQYVDERPMFINPEISRVEKERTQKIHF